MTHLTPPTSATPPQTNTMRSETVSSARMKVPVVEPIRSGGTSKRSERTKTCEALRKTSQAMDSYSGDHQLIVTGDPLVGLTKAEEMRAKTLSRRTWGARPNWVVKLAGGWTGACSGSYKATRVPVV